MYKLPSFLIILCAVQSMHGSSELRERTGKSVLSSKEFAKELSDLELKKMYDLGVRQGIEQGNKMTQEFSERRFKEGYAQGYVLGQVDEFPRMCLIGSFLCVLSCFPMYDLLNRLSESNLRPQPCDCKKFQAKTKAPRSATM